MKYKQGGADSSVHTSKYQANNDGVVSEIVVTRTYIIMADAYYHIMSRMIPIHGLSFVWPGL